MSKITVYVPAVDDYRSKVLEKAIEMAKYNLNVDFDIYPIDLRTDMILMRSFDAQVLAQGLYDGGYNRDEVSIFFVRKDIKTVDTNFCFGATMGKTILLSDYRINHGCYSEAEKIAMLTYLIEHEIGHAFKAADDLHYGDGIYDMHCLNENCVMQQVQSLDELKAFAKHNMTCRGKYERGCFCSHCKKRFKRNYLSA